MCFVVKSHLLGELPERIAALSDGAFLLVADRNTALALGPEPLQRIQDATRAQLHVFTQEPQATRAQAEALLPQMQRASFAIAIGSGTLNDLVKYASHKTGIPYGVIATAPSMNGYTSPTASLIDSGGLKHSFSAHAPAALFADIDILAAAPARMIAAGVGDTLCRSTVEADWRLAHTRGKAVFDESIMAPLRAAEQALFAHTARVAARDPGAIRLLWDALIAGGNAMRAHGSSMPASQGEHMLAHLMESHYPESALLHGEAIAVTTCYMAQLQERLLPTLGDKAVWIGEHRHHPDALRAALAAAGCPTTAEAVGWDAGALEAIAKTAWQTRDRYTFLNMLAEA
jgi:glycerol-1-phosphate dehydrogenase [NAD(P)+]